MESHSRGLSSLGKSEETYGDLLIQIILNKLPRDVRQNLARETATPEWTFPPLMSAILKEIRILETSNSASYKSMSTAMFLLNSKTPQRNKDHDKGPQSCVFFKGPNASANITQVSAMPKKVILVHQ